MALDVHAERVDTVRDSGPKPSTQRDFIRDGRIEPPRRRQLPNPVAAVRQAGANFWDTYSWLLRDLVHAYPKRCLLLVAVGMIGAVLQWAWVVALLAYVNARTTGEGGNSSLPIVGELDLSFLIDSDAALAGWGGIVLALVLLAGAAKYGSQSMAFDTASRYARRAGSQVLEAVEGDPMVLRAAASAGDEADTDPVQTLRYALLRDTTFVLRSLFVVLRSSSVASRLVVSGAIVVAIEPLLTVVLIALGAAFVLPIYRVNRNAARASTAYEGSSRRASLYVTWLAGQALRSDRGQADVALLAGSFADSAAVGERDGSLREIILSRERSEYLVGLFAGVAAVAIVFSFTLAGTDDLAGWSTALVYVAALLAATSALNGISATITAASRFLPQVRRYTQLVKTGRSSALLAEGSVGDDSSKVTVPGQLTLSSPRYKESIDQLDLIPGEPIFVHYLEPLDRISLERFFGRLFGTDETTAKQLRRRAFLCGDVRTPTNEEDRPRVINGRRDAVSELVALEIDSTTPGTPNQSPLGGPSPELHYALTLWPALESDASVLVLGWRSFSQLDSGFRQRLLDRCDSSYLFLVSDRLPGRQPEETTTTVLVDEEGVRGIADAEVHRRWQRTMKAEQTGSSSANSVDGMENELDDV